MKDKFLPIPLYADEPVREIILGAGVRILFASVGYGLSAQLMGKEFKKYAVYGAILAAFSNIAVISYTKYKMREDA